MEQARRYSLRQLSDVPCYAGKMLTIVRPFTGSIQSARWSLPVSPQMGLDVRQTSAGEVPLGRYLVARSLGVAVRGTAAAHESTVRERALVEEVRHCWEPWERPCDCNTEACCRPPSCPHAGPQSGTRQQRSAALLQRVYSARDSCGCKGGSQPVMNMNKVTDG